MDINGWMARATLEMLGQAGLGWSFDPLIADAPDNHLGAAVKLIVCVHTISRTPKSTDQDAHAARPCSRSVSSVRSCRSR